MARVSQKEISDAYVKLKSYVYYENFSVGLKGKLANFEAGGVSKKLKRLTEELNRNPSKSAVIKAHLESIDYSLSPKKFDEEVSTDTIGFYLSNHNRKETYRVSDAKNLTPFIDCPVEIHIISVLWLLRIGSGLDHRLGNACYANRLVRRSPKRSHVIWNSKLFYRYYLNYNRWRDLAIRSAKRLHRQGRDVGILTLDIQNYYSSVDLDVRNFRVKTKDRWLNELLARVHETYASLLLSAAIIKPNRKILPIGIVSSNVLANVYLSPLDGLIQKKIKPAFYGRYVDDLIVVFSGPKVDKTSTNFLSDFIEANFKGVYGRKILGSTFTSRVIRNETDFSIFVSDCELKFQLAKVRLYHFYKSDSVDVLDGFEREIRKNSSEFRFQLESNDLFESFEDSSYEMTYGDTINKLRSIEKFNANKFGASKHLAKLINGTKLTSKIEKKKLKRVSDKILNYFSGKRALELVQLWDKVFAFFIINRQSEELIRFSKHLLRLLLGISFEDANLTKAQNFAIETRVVDSFLDQLVQSYAMASALDIAFFNARVIKRLKEATPNPFDEFMDYLEHNIKKQAKRLIEANLFRQSYLPYPLLNFCNQHSTYSFVNSRLANSTSFKIDEDKIKYSPRFISYHEVQMFYYLQGAFLGRTISSAYERNPSLFVFEKFIKFNNAKAHPRLSTQFPRKMGKRLNPRDYYVDKPDVTEKLKIGIVNLEVKDYFFKRALVGKPVLTFERLDSIHQVLNEAVKTGVKLVIFPEVSIPFEWLSILLSFSKRNDIGVVCGVEHHSNRRKEAFNYVATILPFRTGAYMNSFLDLRLKIDYSPGELKMLMESGYVQPKASKTEVLRLFNWRGLLFTVLNCFEITDINKRTKFKGNVDFVATVEFNRDINYFSSISESLARDLHCYIIQVNSANFGDSRITLPADSFKKDQIKLKGGENISLVVGTISISDLREFQRRAMKNLDLNGLEKEFKPLPPDFVPSANRVPK